MRSISEYRDYRAYLLDYYADRKKKLPGFSYRSFAEAVGFPSPNYLKLIIEGMRNLTVANIHKVAAALDLTGTEIDYFETLVLFNQATHAAEKHYYQLRLSRVITMLPSKKSQRTPTEILKKWYYPMLLLLAHEQSQETVRAHIAKHLNLSDTDIDQTLQSLLSLEVLQLADGFYHVSQQQLAIHDPRNLSKAQKAYLQTQLRLSLKEFDRQYAATTAKFISHTLTVPKDGIAILAKRFFGFLETVTKEMDELTKGDPKHVAQMNIQLFVPSLNGSERI